MYNFCIVHTYVRTSENPICICTVLSIIREILDFYHYLGIHIIMLDRHSFKWIKLGFIKCKKDRFTLFILVIHRCYSQFRRNQPSCIFLLICFDYKTFLNLTTRKMFSLFGVLSGADPGNLVRGYGFFFFKGMGSGDRLKAPSWSRATPLFGIRGRSPRKILNFIDFRSFKFDHIVSPQRS